MLAPLAAEGLTLEALEEKPHRNPKTAGLPFMDGRFRTPSGKFEFITEFSPRPPDFRKDELHLVATKTLRMVNSQILPGDLRADPIVRLNPEVLSRMGLQEGDFAWVVSKVGRVKARVAKDEKMRKDVLLFNPALWKGDLSGVNQLREAFLTDIGGGAAMHQTMVRLEKA
jgi:anaerobic selenocysteine-containing dehydrogenase